MHILLVEDDEQIGEGVRTGLALASHAVDWVNDARSARAAVAAKSYEMVVLDIGLPDECGLDWLKDLRTQGIELPVLILTARDALADKIEGLDSGADDYLVKPFELDELYARLRVIERRLYHHADPEMRHQGILLDPAGQTVTQDGNPVPLSRREFSVLKLLLGKRGRVISRRQIEEQLYEWGSEVESNAVEVHVHHLRRKLGTSLIRTVRGVGYVIEK
ncbi:MAG: response regulator [Gammaproteobacteria bacterium]|nr:response regulator [Gammaproteobacteria bacterium]